MERLIFIILFSIVIAVFILTFTALLNGIDGKVFAGGIGIFACIVGYLTRTIQDKKIEKRKVKHDESIRN